MHIVIGSDHAGYEYKQAIVAFLEAQKHTVDDLGTHSTESVDYPDFAHPLAEAVAAGTYERGILICGTGNGVAITANKHTGVRAGLCWTPEVAALVRQHNDANVLCIPARFVLIEVAQQLVDTFFRTDFEGGRHARRVSKMYC